MFDLNTGSENYTNQCEIGVILSCVSESEDGIEWYLSEQNLAPDIDSADWLPEKLETFILSADNGTKIVYAFIKDIAQNISTTPGTDLIILDTNPPMSQIQELENWQNSNIFTISLSGSDAGTGISSTMLEYTTNAVDGVWDAINYDTEQIDIEFAGEDGFTYYFRAKARDFANNYSEYSEIVSTSVDTFAPEISFALDEVQENLDFELNWTGFDPVVADTSSGVDGFSLYYNATPYQEGVVIQYEQGGETKDWENNEVLYFESDQTMLEVCGNDEISYIFSVQASDKAGNMVVKSAETRIEIPKDDFPPIINSFSYTPVEDPLANLYFSLEWDAEDADDDVENGIDIFALEYEILNTDSYSTNGLMFQNSDAEWESWQENETIELSESPVNLFGRNEYKYKFSLKAIDKAGNESEAEYLEAEIDLPVVSKSVVINEIAWMGTSASSSDEWIELYNNTNEDIDIENWSIYGADTNKCLNFADADDSTTYIVPTKDYLIYANHEDDIANIVDIWDASIGMNNTNSGQIILYSNSNCVGNIVDIIDPFTDNWFAGENSPKQSMERIDSLIDGSDENNWANNNLLVYNGKDADGNIIYGTPKSQNSVSQSSITIYSLPFDDFDIITLPELNSPYGIGELTIPENKTLIVEPGVTLKFSPAGRRTSSNNLIIDGTLTAIGTDEKNIIFTSYLEPDGSDNWWSGIYFNPTSENSKFEYCQIRYGGKKYNNSYAIIADNADFEFKNSILEDFNCCGIKLINSTDATIIDNSTIKNTNSGCAMRIFGGAPIIKNSVFDHTYSGVFIEENDDEEPSHAVFENNVFKNMDTYPSGPFNISDSFVILKDNVFENNIYNATRIHGTIDQDYTLSKGVYILGLTVAEDAELIFEPGVIVKFEEYGGLNIYGTLTATGTEEDKIVFTSIDDDEYGGNTNNNEKEDGVDYDYWRRIQFYSTSENSVFDNCVVRYGGRARYYSPYCDSLSITILVDNADFEFKNSTLENLAGTGIKMINSTTATIIDNSKLFGHCYSGHFIDIIGGAPMLKNCELGYGLVAIYIEDGAKPIIENNSFENFIYSMAIILSEDSYPVFKGNTAENNVVNGIYFFGTVGEDYELQKDLVYVIGGLEVVEDVELNIQPGVIMKFRENGGMNIYGTLTAIGTADEKIVFTSIDDDEYGGNTNNNDKEDGVDYDYWNKIHFYSTSENSIFENAIISYGKGFAKRGTCQGEIFVDNCAVNFNKNIFKNSVAGIYFYNATQSEIRDSEFNNSSSSYYSLKIENSAVSVYNSNFRDGHIAIRIIDANPVLSNIIIENNYYSIIATEAGSCPDLSTVDFINNTKDPLLPSGCE